MKHLLIIILALLFVTSAMSSENVTTASTGSGRLEKPIGVGLGLNDPHSALLGVKGYYNFTDFLRAHIGYGELEATSSIEFNGSTITSKKVRATTYGAGATALVPGWQFSPTAGLAWSHLAIEGDGNTKILGLGKPGSDIYSSLGFDWQLEGGFQLAAGYHLSLTGKRDSRVFANIGWFFSTL